MIGKSFLGESLNFLIGKLKLSYKKVSTIIVESLAAVRGAVQRGLPIRVLCLNLR